MRTAPPKKQKEVPTGARRLDGAVMDVATMAREFGDTEKGIRAKVARGLLPFRRLGARIVFVRDDVSAYLHRLPGVSVDEALANVGARSSNHALPSTAEARR
jgi:hypothetical protein